jgi:hypothetical protein
MKDPVSIFGCWRGFSLRVATHPRGAVGASPDRALFAEDLTRPQLGRRIEPSERKIDLANAL